MITEPSHGDDSRPHRNGDAENDSTDSQEPGASSGLKDWRIPLKRRSRRLSILAIVGGAVLGSLAVVLIFAAILLARRDSPPPLTRAVYEAALSKWQAQGPASYQFDIVLEGRQPGRIHVEVHAGEVTKMTRDGIEPSQHRTWDYWSVPGQFDTIDRELEMAADPMAEFHTPPGSVVQQAEFDPQYGYPRRYRRFVLGTDFEIDWKTTRFQVLDTP